MKMPGSDFDPRELCDGYGPTVVRVVHGTATRCIISGDTAMNALPVDVRWSGARTRLDSQQTMLASSTLASEPEHQVHRSERFARSIDAASRLKALFPLCGDPLLDEYAPVLIQHTDTKSRLDAHIAQLETDLRHKNATLNEVTGNLNKSKAELSMKLSGGGDATMGMRKSIEGLRKECLHMDLRTQDGLSELSELGAN